MATGIAKGMKIEVANNSPFLDTNVPPEEKLYGYHRLKDPLVVSTENSSLLVSKKSLLPPEPLDKNPQNIVWGRDDIKGFTYDENK